MFLYKIDDNLSLKLIELNDAEKVLKLIDASRLYLKEWLSWLDSNKTIEDTKAYIQGCLKGFAENNSLDTVILYNEKIVGVAGFTNINWSNKTATIGYWLGEDYQGKGIMTNVAKALTNYAFTHLKLNKVEIRAAVENLKSRGIPERLGFVYEGTIRQAEWLYDHYVDHAVYGILAGEWTQKST
ncbi:ribosomal-protein-serine acetyltransferase [Ureibacillus xyleni]|uniref:Ribosomal-protein-serine acetyltransferase n=1 Tax=Ureibacillus xyleni TaxID=614648 RepID=A0A285TR24_9BACL|nr:GNAT family protein [Ureibacillus xyleni]SOC23419.1 ribosomal-protein-serine acetyltransferase [Ureibacillus xyleni]